MRRLEPITAAGPHAIVIRPHVGRTSFAPDLALTGAIVAVVYLLLFFGGATALFRDADAGWHIRAGEQILATGALPHVDPFSFSKAGEPWIAWEWGSDLLMGEAHRIAGLNGVAFLYILAIATTTWMWFRLNWAVGGNFLLACLFAAPMLSTTNLHWLARPHVFSWLFLIGTVWFCERMPRKLRRAHLAAAFAFGAIWANIHGSFFLGPLVALVYASGSWLGPRIWDRVSPHPRRFLLTALAAALGSFCNPHGWDLHTHVFNYITDSALLDRIGEFQTFNFHAEGATQIVMALLIGIVGGVAALTCRRPERFLLAIVLTAGALRSARMLPILALILLPLANGSITSVLSNAELNSDFRLRLDRVLDYGLNLRAIDRTLSGLILVPALILGSFFLIHATFPADQFPVAAADRLPANARTFAPDKFGGYLIYRFAGERKVFFDGRSDFYGADFLARYSRMVQVRPGWQKEFNSWHFTHALLPPDYSLIPALTTAGWREVYRDKTAVVLEGPKA